MIKGTVIVSPGLAKRVIAMNVAAKTIKPLGPVIEKEVRDYWKYKLGRGIPPPLAASTLKRPRAAAKAFATTAKKMWKAFTDKSSPNAYRKFGRHKLEIGEKGTVAIFHQERRTKSGTAWVLPARPMKLSKRLTGKIAERLAAYFSGRVLSPVKGWSRKWL